MWPVPMLEGPTRSRTSRARAALVGVGHADLDDRVAHARLEGRRRALGDHTAVVDDDDVVGETVGLLEVLGRQEEGGALADQLLDDFPEVVAAARVEAGRRLVQEQHRGAVDERCGEVEPTTHASAVGLGRPIGGVGQAEALQQLVGAIAHPPDGLVHELADEPEVLPSREVLVHGRVLAGQPDALPDLLGVLGHVDAEHRGAAGIGPQDRGEDAHGGGLAGTVRAEQPEDGASGYGEVDAVEGADGAEAPDETFHLDGDLRSRSGAACRVGGTSHSNHCSQNS